MHDGYGDPAMSRGPRVLLAEADMPTRIGLRLLLTRAGFEISAEADRADAALEAAVRDRPDLALLAADLPGGAMDAVERIAASVPATKIVLLSEWSSGEEVLAAVLAGASGYLAKDGTQARFAHALRGILAGEVALPRRHSTELVEALRRREARRTLMAARADAVLTNREWTVLHLLADEVTTGEMARRLGISQVTVRRHVSTLLNKLGVADRKSAVEMFQNRSKN